MSELLDEWQYLCREDQVDDLKALLTDVPQMSGEALGVKIPLAGDLMVGNNLAETH